MQVGVVSRTFGGWKAEDAAVYMAENGFSSTELCLTHAEANFWNYNGWNDLFALDDKTAADLVGAFRKNGIYVASLGVFTNLMEPDTELLEKNIGLFLRYIDIAAQNGVPAVATECGFVPGRRGVNTDTYEKDFSYFLENLGRVLEAAERRGVDIALETCVLDVVPSAKRTCDLIAQAGSKRLKILLDPANLIANSDEEDMFKYLTPYISYFHGKDRKVNDTYGRRVGEGDINWPLFLRLYHEYAEGKPFILEYVTPENCGDVKNRVLEFDKLAV